MKILVGLDLASESNRYFALDESGRHLGSGPLSWSMEDWSALFDEWGGAEHVIAAFETGPEAYRAEDLCLRLGAETYPFHAGHMGGSKKNRKKTDKKDAERIARRLRSGDLPKRTQLPKEPIAALRNMVTERELLLKILRKVQNRARGLARQWGLKLPKYDSDHQQRWWEEVIAAVGSRHRKAFARLAMVALAAIEGLDELKDEMEEQVEEAGLEEEVEILDSLPGFGRLTAICVAAFLVDSSRFTSGRKVADYVGLVPWVEQTGKSTKDDRILGHITKDGPPVLRRLLVEAAHSANNGNQLQRTRWRRWYNRLEGRRGRKIAAVAMARKLVVTAHALLRDRTKWNPDLLRPTAA